MLFFVFISILLGFSLLCAYRSRHVSQPIRAIHRRAGKRSVRHLSRWFLWTLLVTTALSARASVSVTTANLAASQVTLQLRSSVSATLYFTLLSGKSAICGSAIQTAKGQDSTGALAFRHGSIAATAATTASYTLRNLAEESSYTACISDGQSAPTALSLTTATASISSGESSWSALGSSTISPQYANNESLDFAPDATPYLAWNEASQSYSGTVKRYTPAADWSLVGSANFTAAFTSFEKLAFAPDGSLYLAWQACASNCQLVVSRYSAASGWTQVGSSGTGTTYAYDLSLAFAADSSPLVAFSTCSPSGNPNCKISVLAYSPASGRWSALGSANFTNNRSTSSALVVGPDAIPYLAYRDCSDTCRAKVVRRDSTAATGWSAVGTNSPTPDAAYYESLAFAPDGTLYLAWSDCSTANAIGCTAALAKYNATTKLWSRVGPQTFSANQAYYISLAIAPDGSPYLAWVDNSAGGIVTVMRYSAHDNAWSEVGSALATTSSASYLNLRFSPAGAPYLAFQNGATNGRATVLRYVKAPLVTTLAVCKLAATSATLCGEVDDNGSTTSVWFDFGSSSSYGKSTYAATLGSTAGHSLAANSGITQAALPIASLQPNSTLHYRLVASNANGTAYGEDRSLTTPRLTSTLALKATPATASKGSVITFLATLSNTAATGSIRFTSGTTTLGTCTLKSATCSLSTKSLPTGANQSILATYSGDNLNATAKATTTVTIK